MPDNTATKTCPDCAEEVRAAARKCRFCGYIFSELTDTAIEPEPLNAGRTSAAIEETAEVQAHATAQRPLGRVTAIKVIVALMIVALVVYVKFGVHDASSPSSSVDGSAGVTSPSTPTARDAAVVADLNAWWNKQTSDAPQPEKPGTVTPSQTITINGKPRLVPRHVQTQAGYKEQLKDFEWEEHMRSIVTGFRVSNNTVTVLTNATRNSTYDLNPMDKRDAQELCHELGSFIWASENRHWGVENIRVLGASGELLSSRTGLRGNVE